MQKIIIPLLCASVICLQKLTAQTKMGLFGSRSKSIDAVSPDRGSGFGATLYFKPDTIDTGDKNHPFVFQMGVGGFCSGLGKTYLYGVSSIDGGKVKIENQLYEANLSGRFYFPKQQGIIPYFEFFAGCFDARSREVIIPDFNESHHSRQKLTLINSLGVDLGAGTGFLIPCNKRTSFNLGVSYTGLVSNGSIANLQQVSNDANGINFNFKNAPTNLLSLSIGFVFTIDKKTLAVSQNIEQPFYPSYDPNYPVVTNPSQPVNHNVTPGSMPYYPSNQGTQRGGSWSTPHYNTGGGYHFNTNNGGNGVHVGGGHMGGGHSSISTGVHHTGGGIRIK
ncbi:MAG: hypothetical protein ACXVC6_04375 [Bacteroidia bacterium]